MTGRVGGPCGVRTDKTQGSSFGCHRIREQDPDLRWGGKAGSLGCTQGQAHPLGSGRALLYHWGSFKETPQLTQQLLGGHNCRDRAQVFKI